MEKRCPYRPELSQPDMPASVRRLPVDARGYPVPWFVLWIKGAPEFRIADASKKALAVTEQRCWVCGEPLARRPPPEFTARTVSRPTVAFLVGPMCAVNRISSEPPSHLECAEWSARNCPFLARPHMKRREDEIVNAANLAENVPGRGIMRNPGVSLVWPTDGYEITIVENGYLFRMRPPTAKPSWWAEGRPATRAEILASIETGLPLLEATLDGETPERRAEGLALLRQQTDVALALVPA